MKRVAGFLGAVAALGAAGVVGIADEAGAITSVSTSGTTVTVTITGSDTVVVTCNAGKVSVNAQTGSPAVNCSALTKLTVNGDSGKQTVDGKELENAAFTAKPTLTAVLGAGDDILTDTVRADSIDLGAGSDNMYFVRGTNNTKTDFGPDLDHLRYFGSDAAEEFAASSTSNLVTLNHKVGGNLQTMTALNAEQIHVGTYGGDDVVDLSGIVASSTIDEGSVHSGAGNDVVRGLAAGENFLEGGLGSSNQIFGGSADDTLISQGNDDTLSPGAGENTVMDRTSPRSGRTITNAGSNNWWRVEFDLADTTTRIRPNGTGVRVTNSLGRTGQQDLAPSYGTIQGDFGQGPVAGDARGLVDAVAINDNRQIYFSGDPSDNDLFDLTVPTGTWTTSGTPSASYVITITGGNYKPVAISDFGAVSVHGPWGNKNAGFAHRATRDLAFRFLSDQARATTTLALQSGTLTRAQLVTSTMDTDEYRGLDVDRTFTKYLRRASDPSGRAYWINSIENGKALWRFRAQLFGSNEYFNKAGATNEAYLDKVYQDVLGRLPDPSGRAYWVGKLNAGKDRGSVALAFINANEFRRFIIDDQFLRFLDRKPTTNEQNTWLAKLKSSPTGEQELIASLVASDEYYNRT